MHPRVRAFVAFVPPLIALVVQWALWDFILRPYAWFLFFPAIFVSSWIGGKRAGVTATLVSTVLVWWRFVPPEATFAKEPKQLVPAVTFVLMGILFAVFHDRRRKANEKLRKVLEERQIFAAFIDNSTDFIGIADPTGRPTYLNPAGRRMIGIAPDYPVETIAISECYPPEERTFVEAVILRSMVEQGHWEGETRFRHFQTGEAIPVSDTHFMIRESGTERVLGMGTVTRDISDIQKARDEMAAAHRRVRELAELKTQFFAAVSHELRTPLALILGPASQLLEDPKLDSSTHQKLEVIVRNARTLRTHVDDLLDVARLQAGKLQPAWAEVDVADVAALVAGHFDSLAQENTIAWQVELPAIRAEVDPAMLRRVLFNLLSNAFRFAPEKGRVRLTLRDAGDRYAIEVADSGIGIPADQRELAFEPFRQLDGGTTRRFAGTGLGLAIVRDLVALHGGAVTIGDAPEGGASFNVVMPVRAPEGATVRHEALPPLDDHEAAALEPIRAQPATSEPRPSILEPRPAPLGGTTLVLVVEDNPDMNQFLCDVLAEEHRVVRAFDGRAGLELAIAHRPDLILTDLMMPHMSGDALADAIRSHPELAHTPIVVLTAKEDEEMRIRLLRGGVQDYLVKPFSAEELRVRVSNLVRARRADARFRGLVESAADALVIVDETGTIRIVNHGAERLFGYAREELLGQAIEVLVPESKRDRHRELRTKYLASPHTRAMGARLPLRGRRKDGTEFPADVMLGALTEGHDTLVTAAVRDVTEQKRLENELRDLYDRAPCGYHSLDADARFVRVNDTELAWLDRTRDEVLGHAIWEFATPESGTLYKETFQAFVTAGVQKDVEIDFVRRDGRVIPVLLNGMTEHDAAGAFLRTRTTVLDLTAIRAAQEGRERLIADLQSALAEVRTLSGMLPICAWCKKIRDDEGYWHSVEAYLAARAEVEFTHGMCAACAEKQLAELRAERNAPRG